MDKPKKPNKKLQHERELHGWSQARVAEKLGTTVKRVSMWECGDSVPDRYYQEKFCDLYGKNAEELGLIERQEVPDSPRTSFAPFTPSMHLPDDTTDGKRDAPLLVDVGGYTSATSPEDILVSKRGEPLAVVQGVPVILLHADQAIDLLRDTSDATPEQKLGTLLALEANELATFFDEGWSIEDLLGTLRVVLQGAQAMPKFSRRTFGRKLLKLGTVAVLSGIPIPEGRHISVEDRTKLHSALGESIAAGWKLFHTAGNAQVFAVSQAQLYLVQQNHSWLYPSVRPLFYTGVYRLIGAAQHFQGRYQEAYQTHEKAYIAALEGADAWNMAQSRSWQAYGLKAKGNYPEALQAADAALRLISYQNDTESIRLRARLLAFSAENAALLNDVEEVQTRLGASESLLECLPGHHEEFDRVSWLQQAGACALSLKHYNIATKRLQQALDELPAQWTLRSVSTAVPLAIALTRLGARDKALEVAKKTMPIVKSLQSPTLVQEFHHYLQAELLTRFPNDEYCQSFVVDAQRQLALT